MTDDIKLGAAIAAAYGPSIQRDYGLTWAEFGAYVEEHDGELPPMKNSPWPDLPACWPHFFCDHA